MHKDKKLVLTRSSITIQLPSDAFYVCWNLAECKCQNYYDNKCRRDQPTVYVLEVPDDTHATKQQEHVPD